MDGIMFALLITFTICFIIGFGGYYFEAQNQKILEETKLLITDYSSISYSAFYRGANIIFCWEELEACMKEYQSHLMLNEDNAFGDISYDFSDIKELVKNNYLSHQSKNYQNRYKLY